MDKQKATVKAAEMRAWLENNEELAGALAPMVEAQLAYMETLSDETDIKNIWGSITGMLRTLGEKSPVKRGKGSSLTPEQQGVVSGVRNRIQTAFASIGEFDLIQQVFLRSTKEGQYPNVEAFADHMADKAENNMKRAIRESRWNGLLNDGALSIEPPVAETTDNAETEVEPQE